MPGGLQTFLSEGRASYYTAVRVRGPNILICNVVVSGYVAFNQINKFFVNSFFFIIDKMSLRPDEMASRAVVGLRRPLLKLRATSREPIKAKDYQFDTNFRNKNFSQYIFTYVVINKINDIHLCEETDHVNATSFQNRPAGHPRGPWGPPLGVPWSRSPVLAAATATE